MQTNYNNTLPLLPGFILDYMELVILHTFRQLSNSIIKQLSVQNPIRVVFIARVTDV